MRERILVFTGVMLVAAIVGFTQRGSWWRSLSDDTSESLPQANSEAEKQVLAALQEAQDSSPNYQNVPVADGRMLRVLVEATAAKNVVEIGTSTGVSGLWLCLGLQKTGGRLITFEYDAGRALIAHERFQNAGVDRLVTVVNGDAHGAVERLRDPIDILFINADTKGYVDYLDTLLPIVRSGGLVLAHNIGMADNYVKRVRANPALETLFYMEGGGLALTLKKHQDLPVQTRPDSTAARELMASLFFTNDQGDRR
jgi:caffeoyl-CoA O-methyltransferase